MVTWALLGPALTLGGILVGLGVGWGVLKSTVTDLQAAVGDLKEISTAVTVLQTQQTRGEADVAELLRRVHALEIQVASIVASAP